MRAGVALRRIGRGALAACLATALLAALPNAAAAACSEDRVEIRVPFGTLRFRVEVADDPQERAIGLMHRESLPRFSGMLFVYERPQPVSFWMENTLIPLDMIFLDSGGVVQRVHANAIPLDRTPIPGGPDIQYVLEINGGLAGELGIVPGAVLRHPAITPELAAWSCDLP